MFSPYKLIHLINTFVKNKIDVAKIKPNAYPLDSPNILLYAKCYVLLIRIIDGLNVCGKEVSESIVIELLNKIVEDIEDGSRLNFERDEAIMLLAIISRDSVAK